MNLNAWILLVVVAGGVVVGASALGHGRGLPLASYWAVPLGAGAPWFALVALTVALSALQADPDRAQAMAMTGLFPLFGLVGAVVVGCVASLFVPAALAPAARAGWAALVSGVPALGVLAVLVAAYLDGRA